jgi:hypothetical protein
MNTLEGFEKIGRRGFYRPTGNVSFETAVELVAEAMRFARANDVTELLVNTNALSGFTSPSIFARYALAVSWARAAGATLRVAMVARAEFIDPQKIGVLMAQNRGVLGDVFTNEADALAWLDGHPASKRAADKRTTPELRPSEE